MLTKELYALFLTHPLVDIDTRKIRKGSLFFALKGAHFNANHFAAEALEKGAAFVITDEETDTPKAQTIRRKNALLALQQLAAEHRKHLSAKVIGITGTNGKTTTKELIAAVLSKKYRTVATQGNLNNHIGVPLTLLSIPSTAEMALIEMGANHPGEIAELCRLADPDVGVITNIGKAHLEGFGGEEGVFQTKKALFDHVVKKKGTLFFHDQEPWLTPYRAYPNTTLYGENADYVSGSILRHNPTLTAAIRWGEEPPITLSSKLFGSYNLPNLLAAAAVGRFYHVPPNDITTALSTYTPKNNRSQIEEGEKNTLIWDAYNANPTSMRKALSSFHATASEQKAVILGDMLELGEASEQEHQSLVETLQRNGFTKVFLVGKIFERVSTVPYFHTFAHTQACSDYLAKHPLEGFTILIKGSRGIQLERLGEVLR
ncbi:MAG: UDP-N-acetylmuramoyl-tripeptide--D-alanyl-D-alanine ligase [Bacteroidetes bacterium]|nr:MAG: UDP-N-acetylmuramoyl-tripeptide--D-alanyl-D-alanine ligase [Bacteroidota bacterium]